MPSQPRCSSTAFFARFNERAAEHDRARAGFDGIRSGKLQYDPLFTSRYVLSEFATLMLRKVGHRPAVTALDRIREASSFNVLHSSAILADDRDIEYVFTFDRTDFRTLGFSVVPEDTDGL